MKQIFDKFSTQLTHLPQFVITWSIFFAAGAVVYIAYLAKNRRALPIIDCLGITYLREMAYRKSLYMDAFIYLAGKLTDSLILIPYIFVNVAVSRTVVDLAKNVVPIHEPASFNLIWASLCTILMFLAVELSEYVFHFAEHKFPVLWEFHKLHHSALELNPLTSHRHHPVSTLLAGILRGFMTGIVSGAIVYEFNISNVEAVALSLVASKIFIIATLDPLKHSHFKISFGIFDRLLISPYMHQIHHSKIKIHWDRNFGTNLSIFDWIFGTAYKPAKGERIIYGISGHNDDKMQAYNTLYGAYVTPLIKSAKIIRRNFKKYFAARSGNPTGSIRH